MGQSKYIVLGVISIMWILLPSVFQFMGMPAIEKTSVAELTGITAPTGSLIYGIAHSVLNWVAFYFKILSFSFTGAPVIISLFFYCSIVLYVLAIISLFRGD